MFIVKDDQNPDKVLLTRTGSFRQGPDHSLTNVEGYKLLGYKMDYNWNLSDHLEPINTKKIPALGAQAATTEVSLSMNLRKCEKILPGDGTLKSVSHSLVEPLKIEWAEGALPSEITFN